MEKEIKILYVPIQGEPEEKTVANKLEAFQSLVGGNIETFPIDDDCSLLGVCNEEGKINGMTLNRGVYGDEGQMLDIIAGPFFICGLTEDSFGSLSPELAEKYSNLFQFPEIFVCEGDEIKAVPVKPSVRDKLKTNTAEIKKETQGKEHNKSEHEI